LQHICDLYAKEDPKYKCTDPFWNEKKKNIL
jgi:hypothetical protein